MRRPATQSPRQRRFEWTESMRWEDLPIDVHNQLVVELRAMPRANGQQHAAAGEQGLAARLAEAERRQRETREGVDGAFPSS